MTLNRWLNSWKICYSVKLATLYEEGTSVSQQAVNDWG